jgi:hypothetical protein
MTHKLNKKPTQNTIKILGICLFYTEFIFSLIVLSKLFGIWTH